MKPPPLPFGLPPAALRHNSASEMAQAAQQTAMAQVTQLSAQLEAERARSEMQLQLRDAEHQQKMAAENSKGRLGGAGERLMQPTAGP